ncbi:hypothetical protein RJ639_016498 [Escallonia herrerae]|uniref:Uncharacterized protein n=1 Tax=Escallonia herrerae TaxID=1293975 RepID=A0AA88VGD9_9ASTE|nr:hypothetical protein RJ639_016498 [Escallonia herrerae]
MANTHMTIDILIPKRNREMKSKAVQNNPTRNPRRRSLVTGYLSLRLIKKLRLNFLLPQIVIPPTFSGFPLYLHNHQTIGQPVNFHAHDQITILPFHIHSPFLPPLQPQTILLPNHLLHFPDNFLRRFSKDESLAGGNRATRSVEQTGQIQTGRKRDQIERVQRRHTFVLFDLPVEIFVVKSHLLIRIVKRQIAGRQDVQNDAAGPHIHLRSVVASLCEDLRCHQAVGSDLTGDGTEPEIRHLQIAVFVEEEVFRFQVSVVDSAGVAVSDGGDELLKVLAAEIFAEFAFGDLGEELAALDELHDEDFEELDDVGVTQAAHDGYLALDVGHQARAYDLLLVDDFDGDAQAGLDVPGVVDLGEGAAAE